MKTDTELQRDVLAELNWEPSVNAAQIGVEVEGGIVTLAGHVGSYAEMWDAEHAAQHVSGVKALMVKLSVLLPESGKRTDNAIVLAAESILNWTTYLPKDCIHVGVEKGWITLSGDVDWEYQRQAAARAVRYLTGVTGLTDKIFIKPTVSVSAVQSDIEAALKRRAKEDAQDIAVEVRGAEVKLSGTAHSWPERELARHAAWSIPGVRSVVDNISVAS
jgi:osmotically-inducible protein OsmY